MSNFDGIDEDLELLTLSSSTKYFDDEDFYCRSAEDFEGRSVSSACTSDCGSDRAIRLVAAQESGIVKWCVFVCAK